MEQPCVTHLLTSDKFLDKVIKRYVKCMRSCYEIVFHLLLGQEFTQTPSSVKSVGKLGKQEKQGM